MTIFEQVARATKILRQKRGWSIAELSIRSGLRAEYVRKIEQGKARGMRFSHLVFLMRAFNICSQEFFDLWQENIE